MFQYIIKCVKCIQLTQVYNKFRVRSPYGKTYSLIYSRVLVCSCIPSFVKLIDLSTCGGIVTQDMCSYSWKYSLLILLVWCTGNFGRRSSKISLLLMPSGFWYLQKNTKPPLESCSRIIVQHMNIKGEWYWFQECLFVMPSHPIMSSSFIYTPWVSLLNKLYRHVSINLWDRMR